MGNREALSFLLILAIAFLLYSNTLDNKFLYDDDNFFVRNVYTKEWKYLPNIFSENVIAGSGLMSNYYRPILSLSFLIDYKLWGLSPIGYHISNILMHAITAFLACLLINRIIKNWRISLLSSIVYLAHPLQTEAVTYVTGRADPLSALLALSSMLLFLHAAENFNFKKYSYLSFSLLFFILAILSREVFIVLPFLLALYLICFNEKRISKNSLWKAFAAILPYLIVLGFYVAIRLTMLNFSNTLNFYNEPNIFTENVWYRILTFLSVLLEYFKLILFPIHLNFEREHQIFTDFLNPAIIFSFSILLIIAYLMHRSWRNDKAVFFGFSWFFITLFPVSNIIALVNGIIYEHWLYVPLIGIAAILGHFIKKVLESHYFNKDYIRIIAAFVAVTAIVSLCVRTYVRNDDWQDALIFYQKTIKDAPNSVRLNNNLAMEYDSRGDYGLAESYYKRAIGLNDKFAQPYYNLGNLYTKIGRYHDAALSYENAIQTDPDFLFTYPKLAELYRFIGKNNEAERIAVVYNSKAR